MFNETCGPGTTATEVGGDAPVCLTPAEAQSFESSLPSFGTVNVRPKPADAWTNYLFYGVIALALFAFLGKR